MNKTKTNKKLKVTTEGKMNVSKHHQYIHDLDIPATTAFSNQLSNKTFAKTINHKNQKNAIFESTPTTTNDSLDSWKGASS